MKCGIQWMILALLMQCLPAAAADDPPLTVPALVDRLTPSDGRFQSRYRQTTNSSLLSESRPITGTILFELPNCLRKTERGADVGKRIIEIEDSMVRVTGPEGQQSFLIDNAPALQGLMAILQALASGNGELLVDRFGGTAAGSWSDWTLQLSPEMPEVAAGGGKHDIAEPGQPIAILLEGRDDVIDTLRIDPPRSGPVTIEFLPGEAGS